MAEPFVPQQRPLTKETTDEEAHICPNCGTPLVIRDQAWICFTCPFEEKT